MDVLKALAELHAEQSRLEEAILVLERLLRRQPKRRGRPPKWMSQADGPRTKTQVPKKRAANPRARKRMTRRRRAAKKAEV